MGASSEIHKAEIHFRAECNRICRRSLFQKSAGYSSFSPSRKVCGTIRTRTAGHEGSSTNSEPTADRHLVQRSGLWSKVKPVWVRCSDTGRRVGSGCTVSGDDIKLLIIHQWTLLTWIFFIFNDNETEAVAPTPQHDVEYGVEVSDEQLVYMWLNVTIFPSETENIQSMRPLCTRQTDRPPN